MQIERLLKIIFFLLEKENVTAKKLSEYLGVSRRTILRDMDTLSLSGIPIYAVKGNKGGYSLMDNFILNKTILSEPEQNEILSALQGLSMVKTKDTGEILDKLSTFFKKSPPDLFKIDFTSWGDGSGIDDFSNIKEAIYKKKIVKFTYYNTKGEKSYRTIEPIYLWFKLNSWYLKGFCLLKQELRLFKIARIRDLIITDEIFNQRDLSNSDDGCWVDTFPNRVDLVIKIAPEMAYRVYDYYNNYDIIKNNDGSLTVTQRNEPEDNGMYGFILSFGEYAEVLNPPHIRDVIKEKAQRIYKNYLK